MPPGEDVRRLCSSAGKEDAGEAEPLLPVVKEGIVAAQGGSVREGSGAAAPWGRGTRRWRGKP